MKITSFEQLEEVFENANNIGNTNFSEKIKILNSIEFAMPHSLPSDPFSIEYKQAQLEIYKILTGKKEYTAIECEADNNVNLNIGIENPYPYSTSDAKIISSYIYGVSRILKYLDLPSGSKVLEYGPGWGHSTLAMARSGYEVHAVDIERKFLDILVENAKYFNKKITTLHGLFGETPDNQGNYDAVVFFECFHHCLEFDALIEKLSNSILNKNGKIIFAAECIYGDWFPMPWGLRMDGHSLWAIRSFGWMELGFRETFFIELLKKYGFKCENHSDPNAGPMGSMYVATRM